MKHQHRTPRFCVITTIPWSILATRRGHRALFTEYYAKCYRFETPIHCCRVHTRVRRDSEPRCIQLEQFRRMERKKERKESRTLVISNREHSPANEISGREIPPSSCMTVGPFHRPFFFFFAKNSLARLVDARENIPSNWVYTVGTVELTGDQRLENFAKLTVEFL